MWCAPLSERRAVQHKSEPRLCLGRKEALGGPDTTEGALGGHQVRISSISFQRGSLTRELGSLASELGSLANELGSLASELGSLANELGSPASEL